MTVDFRQQNTAERFIMYKQAFNFVRRLQNNSIRYVQKHTVGSTFAVDNWACTHDKSSSTSPTSSGGGGGRSPKPLTIAYNVHSLNLLR